MTGTPRGFLLVAACYQAFTLGDGALRMLVLLRLGLDGRAPLGLALALLPYEVAGVVTNLLGGWLGSRLGLKTTLVAGLALQALACGLLCAEPASLTLALVGASQLLSGVAKDLAKTSAKSYVRRLQPDDAAAGALYRPIAWMTGSKNAMKGLGYFAGGALLALAGFAATNAAIAVAMALAALLAAIRLPTIARNPKARLVAVVAQPAPVRWLALSRTCLFGARDAWFAVALPLYLAVAAGLGAATVGAILAAWVVLYGGVQAAAPRLLPARDLAAGFRRVRIVLAALAAPLFGGAFALAGAGDAAPIAPVLAALGVFGGLFALASSLHSWLVVAIAGGADTAERVGFYYAANSIGRLAGTVASGWIYGAAATPAAGLQHCLFAAALAALAAAATAPRLRAG